MKSLLVTLAAFLISGSALADKPNANACPCYDSSPGLLDIAVEALCSEEYYFVRSSLFRSGREVQISLLEAYPGGCYYARLLDVYSGQSSCSGYLGSSTESGGCSILPEDEFLFHELSVQEVKNCDLAMRELAKQLGSLPPCN